MNEPRSTLRIPNPEEVEDAIRIPKLDARAVKDALLRRHPSVGQWGEPGAWTCLEEFENIDLLAFAAWTKPAPARCVGARIGYEVKVSRGDMRTELLHPGKRQRSVERCHEFYFAVPAGLLTDEERAFEEPEWEWSDFQRTPCPRAYGQGGDYPSRCSKGKVREPFIGPLRQESWNRHGEPWRHDVDVPCPECGGKGYAEKSRVERESPTLWIPANVGLVEIASRGVSVVKKAPLNKEPLDFDPKALGELVRWASYRPDRRHLAMHRGTGCESAATDEVAA